MSLHEKAEDSVIDMYQEDTMAILHEDASPDLKGTHFQTEGANHDLVNIILYYYPYLHKNTKS